MSTAEPSQRKKKSSRKRGREQDAVAACKRRYAMRSTQKDVLQQKEELVVPGTDGMMVAWTKEGVLASKAQSTDDGVILTKTAAFLSELELEKVQRVQTSFGAVTIDSLAVELVHKYGTGRSSRIDFTKLAGAFGRFLQGAPPVSLVYGPAGTEVLGKKRNASNNRATKAAMKMTAKQKQDVQRRAKDAPEVSKGKYGMLFIEQVVQIIQQHSPIPLYELVLNPASFTQSVENLFSVSFIIQRGMAEMAVNDDSVPIITAKSVVSMANDSGMDNVACWQAILSIDYATYLRLLEKFHITATIIPHRDETSNAVMGGGPE